MTVMEPDVTLTDYGLTVLCVVLAVSLRRHGRAGDALRFWFTAFFLAIGAASLAGGTVHGFLADETTTPYAVVWSASLLAVGASAVAAWAIGGRLMLAEDRARVVIAAAVVVFGLYTAVVLVVSRQFVVAILHYLPATLFLLASFLTVYVRTRQAHLLAGAAGMLLMFVAAAVQQAGIALHPVYFNHNALYHVIQAVALYLVYRAARGAVTRTTPSRSATC